jgi:hypothetical protein
MWSTTHNALYGNEHPYTFDSPDGTSDVILGNNVDPLMSISIEYIYLITADGKRFFDSGLR